MKAPSHFFSLIKYSIIPAAAYCIPVVFYLRDDTYSMTWLLYLGNALFLAGMFIIALINNRLTNSGSNLSNNGLSINIVAIVLAVIIICILLLMFLPGTHANLPNDATRIPGAVGRKSTGSLVSLLLANAVIGNFVAGTFAILIARGSSEKDQIAR